ncbi:unnamed protein product [Durusdinium trenchii]|uniref:Uncharacterized protein n=1 Tax=Durusdinium trenchii TaxID=1381693 RepID=A0ABP0IGC9_9DINO
MTWDMTLEELAEKQYKELQNGRLAMLAFAGMATQYLVTGRAVGFADDQQPFSFIQGSAMRILEMLSELLMLRPDHFVQKGHLLEKIEFELETSKAMLLQHSKGLLGSDLAELRIQKSEKKALFDKIAKRNRSFTQDIAGQRQRLRHFSDEHAQVVSRILKEAKEASSLQAFGRETQACMLAVFEHKLNSVFSVPLDRKPSEVQAAPTQPTRLENSFLKERVSSLEQQVDLLTQKIATVQRQHAVLIATKDPGVTLPAGVTAGQAAQQLKVTEEQIEQFQEDGVIMIKGAMKEWVEYLQKVTEDQIEKPHLWSLVGRMSGMYDYIQRNMWMTNNGFRDFLYYSPLGHVVSQLGKTEEVRCSTDMLLVNPNRGFGWHQDNQNGPIDFKDAIRWWVAMDPCGQDGIGAPEYLLGSHRNQSVSSDAVFVSLEDGDLNTFPRKTRYTPEPGDLIIWDARTIHRIVAPPGQKWEDGTQRRAIGGTMAKAGATYINKGGASGISDLAGHNQLNGEPLGGPYFPRIYPTRVKEEEDYRAENRIVGRSPQKIANLGVTLASNASKYVSFTKVVGKKD